MTSTAKTIQYSGKQKLHDIVTFHGSGEDGVFYQESLVPFFLMRMTVKKDNPEASFFSIYTPETQIHVPSAAALKGRGFHSQHQHNCFEFTYVLEGDMYQLVEGKRYYYPTGSCCLMNRNTLHTEERSSDYTCIFLSVSPEFVRKLMNDGKPLLFPGEQALYRNLIFEFFQQNLEDSTKDRKDFIDFVPKITQPEQVERVHQLFEKPQPRSPLSCSLPISLIFINCSRIITAVRQKLIDPLLALFDRNNPAQRVKAGDGRSAFGRRKCCAPLRSIAAKHRR